MSSEGITTAPGAVRAPAQRPAIGAVLDTIHGRQMVMDVVGTVDDGGDRATVYLRPEGGGLEWSVSLSSFSCLFATPGGQA